MGARTTHASSRSLRVVVVDDHAMLLESIVRLLNDQPDITVAATAATVADGLHAVQQHQPDVVVLDYQLPDGDGATAARAILQAWPDMHVIMLTGSGSDAAVFEAAKAGCSGYLEKTQALAALVGMVRRISTGATELPAEQLGRLPAPDELTVHYQPIVNLETEAVAGYEALVRWAHPNRGLVPPAEFIALAERTTVILDIGDRVRAEACHQAAAWAQRAPRAEPRFMSVNLSGREVLRPDIGDRISEVLETTGMDPKSLVIEVTESFFLGDAAENTARLWDLRDRGVRIALDDFGTGYSSLAYLRRFPIDIIKLDKSFTDELPHGERGLRLIDSVRQLASDMGAIAEAEGIETAEQAACLASLGWELGQGFYFSRPLSAEAIEAKYGA